MKIESPKIYEKGYDQLVKEMSKDLKELIRRIQPGQEPQDGDPGLALIKIFAHMAEEVIHRLNRVPQKHFEAFLDMLGITLLPSGAAKAPVTFYLAEGSENHVMIPKGTPTAAGDTVFETRENMWATPAKLVRAFALDGTTDQIFPLPAEIINGKNNSTAVQKKGIELFTGENLQTHILYLGHAELFQTAGEVKYEISGLNGPFETLTWKYGGEEKTVGNETGEEIITTDWHSFTGVYRNEENGNLVLDKSNNDEIKEKEINGIKSMWVQCIAGASPRDQFESFGININELTVAKPKQEGETGFSPDMIFCNDIPVEVPATENPIYPFGTRPARFHAFYIGSREAFSKKDAQITLHVEIDSTIQVKQNDELQLSWEYGTTRGWKIIPGVNYKFLKSSEVSFTCPTDMETVNVGGQDNYWLRVRIIEGDYGKEVKFDPAVKLSEEEEPMGKWVKDSILPPRVSQVTISYELPPTPLQHIAAQNNLEFQGDIQQPFVPLVEEHQALYLGFDKQIQKGPISIYFSFETPREPNKSTSTIKWYYRTAHKKWEELEVIDNTRHLTENGIVEFFVPPGFTRNSLLGNRLYWIKVLDSAHEMHNRPGIKGIYLNTTTVHQVQTIKNETLGSGNGRPGQTFQLRKTPVISEEIWMEETRTLTPEEKRAIPEENNEKTLREIKDETGKTTGLYVRWQAKDDFFGSSAKDRHYVIERANGRVLFGDGIHGMIPAKGSGNIIASYRVGGGRKGKCQYR
jgi:hypothetical protein